MLYSILFGISGAEQALPFWGSSSIYRIFSEDHDVGEHNVDNALDPEKRRRFMQQVLDEVRALERMMAEDLFEGSWARIGAEQEVFLVDPARRPAPTVLEVLKALDGKHQFTTELARFNLEFNLDPIDLGPHALDQLESDLKQLYDQLVEAAESVDTQIALIGILPTLDSADVGMNNMTPIPRYYALSDAMKQLRGSEFRFHIKGRDELNIKHDNVMLEACNTSFQIHLQVSAPDFARLYNIAQAIAAPTLSAGTFSPLLFGKRLWNETRIALFQQAVDTRFPDSSPRRQESPRVSFGEHWLNDSVLDIFREDLTRFRLLLSGDTEEDPFAILDRGEIPSLKALRLHNGTVYRWNRPCYGILDGKPHLRIENRILPSGPSLVDEVANCAFWIGLMKGMDEELPDISTKLRFGQAKENFLAAARLGLEAQLTWTGQRTLPASTLILEELLPLARQGVRSLGIEPSSGDRFLDLIEERVRTGRTGSQWIFQSLAAMGTKGRPAERYAHLTNAVIENQKKGQPVHTWELAQPRQQKDWGRHYTYVRSLMTTDLFTVNEDEVIDLAACIMDWKHVRHVPVENNQHELVGILTHRNLLRVLVRYHGQPCPPIAVREVMRRDVITVQPSTSTLEAIALMRQHKVGCLPVVERDRLVGIVSERDLIHLSAHLLEAFLDPVEEESSAEVDVSQASQAD